MPVSKSYDSLLRKTLKDEKQALAYLDASLEEDDPRLFLIALRNVTQARGGVGRIARRAGLNRESLYRTLSTKGNPRVQTLAAILGALGVRLSVEKVEGALRKTKKHPPICSSTLKRKAAPVLSWSVALSTRSVHLAAA
jgi:probable addiction module antidote protein